MLSNLLPQKADGVGRADLEKVCGFLSTLKLAATSVSKACGALVLPVSSLVCSKRENSSVWRPACNVVPAAGEWLRLPVGLANIQCIC